MAKTKTKPKAPRKKIQRPSTPGVLPYADFMALARRFYLEALTREVPNVTQAAALAALNRSHLHALLSENGLGSEARRKPLAPCITQGEAADALATVIGPDTSGAALMRLWKRPDPCRE